MELKGNTTAEINEYPDAHGLDKIIKEHRYRASKHLKENQIQRWVEVKQNRKIIDLQIKELNAPTNKATIGERKTIGRSLVTPKTAIMNQDISASSNENRNVEMGEARYILHYLVKAIPRRVWGAGVHREDIRKLSRIFEDMSVTPEMFDDDCFWMTMLLGKDAPRECPSCHEGLDPRTPPRLESPPIEREAPRPFPAPTSSPVPPAPPVQRATIAGHRSLCTPPPPPRLISNINPNSPLLPDPSIHRSTALLPPRSITSSQTTTTTAPSPLSSQIRCLRAGAEPLT